MKRKILSVLLISLLIINILTCSFAFATENTDAGEEISETTQTEEMQEEETPVSDPLGLKAKAAILMDMRTGRVLYEKRADEKYYPASTTKIMTSILTLENLSLDTVLEASYEAVFTIPWNSSNIGITDGEHVKVEDLLYAMLVPSANEACNIVAEGIAGSTGKFVDMMNEKAATLGMTNTHFVNANGLHEDDHYTTARDLAILGRYAMQNETFREIVSTSQYVMEPTDKQEEKRYLNTTNYMLSEYANPKYYYDKTIGIKTGYTSAAEHCLVSAAADGETELIAVVLKAPYEDGLTYSFVDSKKLLEYGFDNYSDKVIVKPDDVVGEADVKEARGQDYVTLVASNELRGLLDNTDDVSDIEKKLVLNEDIKAPVLKGDVLGSVVYTYKGVELGTVAAVAGTDVKRNWFIFCLNKILGFLNKWYIKVPLITILVLFAGLFALRQYNLAQRRKRARLRKRGRTSGRTGRI